MKRLLFLVLVVLLTVSTPCIAKWSTQGAVNFHGHMGILDMELETLDIDLSDEPLYPGWSQDITFTITNTGNIPFNLEGLIQDAPSFLNIVLDLPNTPVKAGATASITLQCSIDSQIEDSMGDDAAFKITLTAVQI